MSKITYDTDKGGYQRKVIIKSVLIYIVLVILTIICLAPLWILFVSSTLESSQTSKFTLIPGSYFFKNYKTLTTDETFSKSYLPWYGLRNSLIIAGCCAALTVFFAALTAYGLVVYDFKLKTPAFVFIIAVMMIPTQVTAVGFISLMEKFHLQGKYALLILPSIAPPAVVFFMRQYLLSSFPLDIIEASRIDGASEFRTFLTISIPMMKPAFAVQAIFAFISKWNDYYTQSLVLAVGSDVKKQTLPIMVNSVSSVRNQIDHGAVNFAIFFSIIPVALVYILLSRFIIGGVAAGGVKE
ncbi:MAG: carbohydrate ABC transporter permease [Oscillospiraceae bacterium]|nr:carbohydrate ABC transporter permease [Oscillospiraceae bacterium]MBQ8923145.1 carbohydrate ABC transporter permease [Oscillospiraceae bacterium]